MAHSIVTLLAGVAEEQWGLVTRWQVEKAGVARATVQRLADDSVLERVAHGVYRLAGAPIPDHIELRAAWLQFAPNVAAWARTAEQGVVSHRSAASIYGLGHLPADCHNFTFPARRQSRRPDVRIHRRSLASEQYVWLHGCLITRPAEIASDLLRDNEDPGAVAQLISEAIRDGYDYPVAFAESLAPHATRFGLRPGDGPSLLEWMLDLVGDPRRDAWFTRANADSNETQVAGSGAREAPLPASVAGL